MGRDGYIVPVDPQVGPKKKTASSRSWILMDATGEDTVLDVDKYAIMHRVQIHARDLRILDPLLSYPSTILGREKAIVLNLEHIKAIITAEEVLLRDPLDDNVIPVVEELRRRLPPTNAIREVQADGKELGGQNEVDTGEEDESPFEFRALEVALEAICSFLAARTTELETAAYPALDELTSKISSRNLDRVRKLKSAMTRLTARVQKVRDELEQLLDDDDDMADLYLSRKLAGASSPVVTPIAPLSQQDIAGTLATEEAEDSAQVAKLRSALESVDHKRRKILQQMRSDVALLTLEDGGSPVRNPSTAAEDARLASLISLDGILKQVKDITRPSSVSTLGRSKKKVLLASLDELAERMPSLLDIDHPCAQRHIADARRLVESIPEEDDHLQETSQPPKLSDLGSGAETDVAQWNVLQFNTGSTTPFIIKCGANSNSELVIKAEARVQEPKGGEIVRVVPRPTILENMSLEEMKQVFSQLPEALTLLALARTADGTRARYSRLYRTLAMKVPALRDLVGELEKGGVLKDVRP